MALPWTQADPERGAVNGPFNCKTCLPRVGPIVRGQMHCGFLPRSQWAEGRKGLPKYLGPDPYTAEECPGWLVRLPEVADAAELYAAAEGGMLARRDPLNHRVVNEAVQIARRSFNLYTAERNRILRQRAEVR